MSTQVLFVLLAQLALQCGGAALLRADRHETTVSSSGALFHRSFSDLHDPREIAREIADIDEVGDSIEDTAGYNENESDNSVDAKDNAELNDDLDEDSARVDTARVDTARVDTPQDDTSRDDDDALNVEDPNSNLLEHTVVSHSRTFDSIPDDACVYGVPGSCRMEFRRVPLLGSHRSFSNPADVGGVKVSNFCYQEQSTCKAWTDTSTNSNDCKTWDDNTTCKEVVTGKECIQEEKKWKFTHEDCGFWTCTEHFKAYYVCHMERDVYSTECDGGSYCLIYHRKQKCTNDEYQCIDHNIPGERLGCLFQFQSKTITEQLNAGVRALDLDLSVDAGDSEGEGQTSAVNPGEADDLSKLVVRDYFLDSASQPIEGILTGTLRDVLKQVEEWLKANPYEVVQLRVPPEFNAAKLVGASFDEYRPAEDGNGSGGGGGSSRRIRWTRSNRYTLYEMVSNNVRVVVKSESVKPQKFAQEAASSRTASGGQPAEADEEAEPMNAEERSTHMANVTLCHALPDATHSELHTPLLWVDAEAESVCPANVRCDHNGFMQRQRTRQMAGPEDNTCNTKQSKARNGALSMAHIDAMFARCTGANALAHTQFILYFDFVGDDDRFSNWRNVLAKFKEKMLDFIPAATTTSTTTTSTERKEEETTEAATTTTTPKPTPKAQVTKEPPKPKVKNVKKAESGSNTMTYVAAGVLMLLFLGLVYYFMAHRNDDEF